MSQIIENSNEQVKRKVLLVIKDNPQPTIKKKESSEFDDNVSDDNSDGKGLYRTGRWQSSEHLRFIKGCLQHGNNWKKVKECVKTRSSAQIRSHAQKYIIKLCKKFNINDNRQLKNFKNFNRKINGFVNAEGQQAENVELRDLTGCDMEQIEEMILGIFKSNSDDEKKVIPINFNAINFPFKDDDDDDDNYSVYYNERKNNVFKTSKEQKIREKKIKQKGLEKKVRTFNNYQNNFLDIANGLNVGSLNNINDASVQALLSELGAAGGLPNFGALPGGFGGCLPGFDGSFGGFNNFNTPFPNNMNVIDPNRLNGLNNFNIPFNNMDFNNASIEGLLQSLANSGAESNNSYNNDILNLLIQNPNLELNDEMLNYLLKANNVKPEDLIALNNKLNTNNNSNDFNSDLKNLDLMLNLMGSNGQIKDQSLKNDDDNRTLQKLKEFSEVANLISGNSSNEQNEAVNTSSNFIDNNLLLNLLNPTNGLNNLINPCQPLINNNVPGFYLENLMKIFGDNLNNRIPGHVNSDLRGNECQNNFINTEQNEAKLGDSMQEKNIQDTNNLKNERDFNPIINNNFGDSLMGIMNELLSFQNKQNSYVELNKLCGIAQNNENGQPMHHTPQAFQNTTNQSSLPTNSELEKLFLNNFNPMDLCNFNIDPNIILQSMTNNTISTNEINQQAEQKSNN